MVFVTVEFETFARELVVIVNVTDVLVVVAVDAVELVFVVVVI